MTPLVAREARAEAGVMQRFCPEPPAVPAERILRIQGYTDLGRVRPVIRKAAEAMAETAARLSDPVVAFRHVAIDRLAADGTLLLEGGARLHCPAFLRHLAGCSEVAPFVLTLGERLPLHVIELIDRGDLLEGLLLETAGWLAIEDATRQFKSRLREASLARGRRITSRMGPGYSYKVGTQMSSWALEEQPALFALLAGPLPVSLAASCAMTPKMSRSGLYGIAPIESHGAAASGRARKSNN